MSTIEVNTIAPISGSNDVTLGGSSKNIKFASGTTVDFSTNTPTVSGLPANTPSFQAKLSTNTNISDATTTLMPLNTEQLDTDGCYNNTGSTVTLNGISTPSYAFAPNVAGNYHIQAQSVGYGGSTSGLTTQSTFLYFNGSAVKSSGINLTSNAGYVMGAVVQMILTFNGTSDYVQAYAYIDGNSEARLQAHDHCTISGYRLI
jgi:hypothetical protein